MTAAELTRLLELAGRLETAAWSRCGTQRLAESVVGDGYGVRVNQRLRGDAALLWLNWFVDGVVDSERYGASRAQLLQATFLAVNRLFAEESAGTKRELTRAVARIAYRRQRRAGTPRRSIFREEKMDLLAEASGHPRCWICGFRFSTARVRSFLSGGSPADIVKPDEVDYMAPRGCSRNDLRIEVDHVLPIARGGTYDPSNLRIACGWCNRQKAHGETIYGTDDRPQRFDHPRLGPVGVPQSFWVVRVLALSGRCEIDAECTNGNLNSQLYVATETLGAGVSPSALVVCCRDHDPMRDSRFVPRLAVSTDQ